MSGPVNYEESRGAHNDARGSGGGSYADDLERHIASLPSGVMTPAACAPVAEAPPPPEQPASPPTATGPAETLDEPHPEFVRGVPAYVGERPPTYPPHPLRSPSVRNGDYFAAFTPAILLDGTKVGRLTVRAASLIGDSHNWEGTCRQDSMTVTRIGPPNAEMLLLAVADGVGSAKQSHVGSHSATRDVAVHLDGEAESIHEALRAHNEGELGAVAGKAVARMCAEWEWTARKEGRPHQDYATTLHVLLVPTDPHVRERVLFSVGDGGLFVLRDGGWHTGSPAGDGVVLDTRTEALPHAYRSVKSMLLQSRPGEVLLLGTDGITNPLTQKDPAFARHLAAAWGGPEVPSMSDFLWQAQTRAKSYDDDRTVICVWEETE